MFKCFFSSPSLAHQSWSQAFWCCRKARPGAPGRTSLGTGGEPLRLHLRSSFCSICSQLTLVGCRKERLPAAFSRRASSLLLPQLLLYWIHLGGGSSSVPSEEARPRAVVGRRLSSMAAPCTEQPLRTAFFPLLPWPLVCGMHLSPHPTQSLPLPVCLPAHLTRLLLIYPPCLFSSRWPPPLVHLSCCWWLLWVGGG